MSLTAGVISASELNTEFGAFSSSISSTNLAGQGYFQFVVDVIDLTTSTNVGVRTTEFRAVDDLELVYIGTSLWNPDTTTRSVTVTLTSDTTALLLEHTFSQSTSNSTASEALSRTAYTSLTGTRLFLLKGVKYYFKITRTDVASGNIDRCTAVLGVKTRRRR